MKKLKSQEQTNKIKAFFDKTKKSINAKTERSEKDVINSLNFTLGALFIIQFLTFLLVLVG